MYWWEKHTLAEEVHQQACRSLDSLDSSVLSISKILDYIFIIL